MNSYQQQHSFVQNVDGQFEKVTIQQATTTKMKQKTSRFFYTKAEDPGTGADQRLGNMIYVDRVECSYTLTETASNDIGPDETITNANASATATCMTDPRLRIMVVTPTRQYRFLPTAGNATVDTAWPFYSTTSGAAGYYEPLSKPVDTSQTFGWGLDIPANTKKFTIHYDDLRNICMSKIGFDSGSFSFLFRKEFEYDDTTTGLNALQCMGEDIEKLIPQIWFIQAPQMNGAATPARNESAFVFAFSIRIYFNNV